tara:strand:+ start:421 stop:1224 length:804 start_codon:yes stop_codon:yes gene_type:complete
MNEIQKIKQLDERIDDIQLIPTESNFDLLGELHDQRNSLIAELNKKTNWREDIGTFNSFLLEIESMEEKLSLTKKEISKESILSTFIEKLIHSSKEIVNKDGAWRYCNKTDYIEVIIEQNDKLNYLIESLQNELVIFIGPTNIIDLVNQSYKLSDVKAKSNIEIGLPEKQKNAAKLNLAILYKLGLYNHLKEIDSIKENDSVFSRILNSFLGGGKSTYQPYLSAAKSNPKSNSSQNYPFSDKLLEKAEEILIEAGVSYEDLVKNPSN